CRRRTGSILEAGGNNSRRLGPPSALSSPLVAEDASVPHIQCHAHEVIRHGEEALRERLWLPALQRLMCFLWRGHSAVPDHCHGEADGGGSVHVLAVYVLDVGEAPADAVLDAPAPPAGRPLDGRPQLTGNREAVDAGWAGMELHLDHAVSARIRGRLLAFFNCFHGVFLLAGGSATFSRSRTLRGQIVEAGQDGRPRVSRLWRFGTSRRVGLSCGSARSATAS